MNLMLDLYFAIVEDVTETAEGISSFISQNLVRLVREFRAKGLNPNDLINCMVVDDFVGRYGAIRKLVPEFQLIPYLQKLKDLDFWYRDLIEAGVHPDMIVKASPDLLSFEEKNVLGVSPDLILEMMEHLDTEEAISLLERGADPNKVASKADLPLSLMIEYGVNPKSIIHAAMKYDANLVREHIGVLFKNGLTAEELLDAEVKALNVNFGERYEIFNWYIENFAQIIEHAEDREGLTEELMHLVDEIYYGDDLMPMETGDHLFLEMMRKCVEHKLISLDNAVGYLYEIHPIPFDSRLVDVEYTRAELAMSS